MFARMRVGPRRLLGIAVAVAAGAAVPAAAAGDISAPVITRAVTGSAGEGGWFRGAVNVRWTVTDPESPWTSTGCDARTLSAETTGEAMECRAASAGGSSSDGMVVEDRLDAARRHGLGARAPAGPRGLVPRAGRRPLRRHRRAVGHRRVRHRPLRGARLVPRVRLGHVHGPRRQREPGRRPRLPLRRHRAARRAPEQLAPREPPRLVHAARPLPLPRARRALEARPLRRRHLPGPGGARVRHGDVHGPGGQRDHAGLPGPLRRHGARRRPARELRGEDGHPPLAGDGRGAPVPAVALGQRRPATRRVVYRGRRHSFVDRRLVDRRRYRYKLVAVDRAGNRGAALAVARPRRALLAPGPDARTATPPVLRWTRCLAPASTTCSLCATAGGCCPTGRPGRSTTCRPPGPTGAPQALVPGTYTWYVWAAVRKGHRYQFGRLVGRRRFTVVAGR